MSKNIHILLKYDYDTSRNGVDSLTIKEHEEILNKSGRVIWGRYSSREGMKGIGLPKLKKIKQQVSEGKDTYIFFLSSFKDKSKSRDLHVARYIRSYNKGELKRSNPKFDLVPKYYSDQIGTDTDGIVMMFELKELIKLKTEDLQEIFKYDKEEDVKIIEDKGTSSFFYSRITDKLSFRIERLFESNDKGNILNEAVKDKEEEDLYQTEVESLFDKSSGEFEDKVKPSKSPKIGGASNKYPRDPKIGVNSIKYAENKCEVDMNHEHFISRVTQKTYVEAHHLIPIKFYANYPDADIDVESNVVSLCIVCHKKLHHGNYKDKVEILKKLYSERKSRLETCGINCSLEELLSYYR